MNYKLIYALGITLDVVFGAIGAVGPSVGIALPAPWPGVMILATVIIALLFAALPPLLGWPTAPPLPFPPAPIKEEAPAEEPPVVPHG